MAHYIEDPINIKGISSLLNQNTSKSNISFVDIENDILKKPKPERRATDDSFESSFDEQLASLSKSYGISLAPVTSGAGKRDIGRDSGKDRDSGGRDRDRGGHR